MAPLIFSIEGNMGAGKTTFVENLKAQIGDKISLVLLEEPVNEWQSIKDKEGTDILSHFYKDQKKYAFQFQMMAYISRLALLKKTINENPDSVIITERSIHSDKNIFAKMLYDSEQISEIEYQIYNKWFYHFANEVKIHGLIYLCCDPKTADIRVTKRSRTGENIPLEYLIQCQKYHDVWIENENIPVLKIDCNKENCPETIYDWNNEVLAFIRSKMPTNLNNIMEVM